MAKAVRFDGIPVGGEGFAGDVVGGEAFGVMSGKAHGRDGSNGLGRYARPREWVSGGRANPPPVMVWGSFGAAGGPGGGR